MNRTFLSILLLTGPCILAGISTAWAEALPSEPFTETLDNMLKDERLVSYDIRSLTTDDITVKLTYSGDHRYSDAELAPFNNGVCYALLGTAVRTGLMPFTGHTEISCQAIQQKGERAEAGALGVSRYQRASDDFDYQSTR
ncbi:hypothetical protein GCM10010082_04840 [Kushneria pakistanensis]|uniref:Uncharacterized protein n=1 Tax=Kushneria pakistanensis TaxID=1508770 RepID=A0ABQ3FB63_9GAMM|nr:hypothetical protein [Kushneria pakistanensis]GHC16896.1 hypothetical protein GCM10010082_04840 [Kushneria pakistanensis]